MEVTKDMLIGEILKKDQTIAAILMRVFDTLFAP